MPHPSNDSTETRDESCEPMPSTRKPYSKPEITHELNLETRAGSQLGLGNPLNPFDPRPKL